MNEKQGKMRIGSVINILFDGRKRVFNNHLREHEH